MTQGDQALPGAWRLRRWGYLLKKDERRGRKGEEEGKRREGREEKRKMLS